MSRGGQEAIIDARNADIPVGGSRASLLALFVIERGTGRDAGGPQAGMPALLR